MSEQNGFRTSFRGFNRQDVMDYMDGVQADFSEREAGLREGLSQANAYLASLTEENKKLKEAADNALRQKEALRVEAYNRFEQMNAQLVALKKENEQLKLSAATPPAYPMQSMPTVPSVSSNDTAALLAAIQELRMRGSDFLAASGAAGEACLNEMDALISTLEASLQQMRGRIGSARADLHTRRDAAGLRLGELEASLKGETAIPLPTTPSVSAPAAPKPMRVAPSSLRNRDGGHR